MTSTTVYCARWKEYGGGWEHSNLSWADLETKVFGQAYAPSRSNVTFSSYEESQDVR